MVISSGEDKDFNSLSSNYQSPITNYRPPKVWPISISKQFHQLLRPRLRLAIAEACLIGLVAALSAVLLKAGVEWFGSWRVHVSHQLPALLVLPAIGFSFSFLSGFLVERFAIDAYGSGIPQVKAALALFPVTLNLRVALVKVISCTLALGAGLTLGRQGPTVQVGAAVAAQLSRWVPTSPEYQRQMIAAGAGAGLAAAFNAPIAGVLFIVEELLHDVSGFTLGTAILASFIGAVVSRLLGGRSFDLDLESTALHSSFSFLEIPSYLVLGVLAGLLGALFCQGIIASQKLYKRFPLSLPLRMGLAGLVSGVAIALLPDFFRDYTGLRELLLSGEEGRKVAATAFVAQFILTLVAFGSGAPGGLFTPSLILGSALGYLVGSVQSSLLGINEPTTYALAGMGAFFSAVSKVPITAIVIVFEITTDFNLVLPLMIGSVTAYLVAEQVSAGSIYDRLLALRGIKLEKEPDRSGRFASVKAQDVMQRRVETISTNMTLDEAIQTFSRSHHRGFPVVDDGKLVGIVTQTDLAIYSQRQLPGSVPISRIMTPKPVTVSAGATLADVLYLLNRYQLSRLPVTEGHRLVGIITRSDLIRAEANQLSGTHTALEPRFVPSYVVYQTRAPALGQGRLLVPLVNPQTATAMLRLAAAIARERKYDLVCLHVILVPRHNDPQFTPVRTSKSRRMLRQAENLAPKLQVAVHTQVRLAHDSAQAILETIKEQHINLLLMGWNVEPSTGGKVFGSIVDTLIRQAACELVLVKLGIGHEENTTNPQCPITDPSSFRKWLVPIAGGPNVQQALQLLPALVSLNDAPAIKLAQVFHPSILLPDTSILEKSTYFLSSRLNTRVMGIPVRSTSVSQALINLANTDKSDVVVLGASREGLLKQAISGNLPEAIACGVNSTVILVRGAIS